MDGFILDCANELEVNLKDYGLPSTLVELTKVTKDVKAKNDTRFKDLFMSLQKSEEMTKLRSALNYLNDNQYKCDTAELQKKFE